MSDKPNGEQPGAGPKRFTLEETIAIATAAERMGRALVQFMLTAPGAAIILGTASPLHEHLREAVMAELAAASEELREGLNMPSSRILRPSPPLIPPRPPG